MKYAVSATEYVGPFCFSPTSCSDGLDGAEVVAFIDNRDKHLGPDMDFLEWIVYYHPNWKEDNA